MQPDSSVAVGWLFEPPATEKTPLKIHKMLMPALALVAAAAAFAPSTPVAVRAAERPFTVIVQPGETLWSIASRTTHDADVRDAVDRIIADNRLPSAALVPGQHLTVRP